MAQITLCAWNIEVYGPAKYGNRPNNVALANLVGATLAGTGANIIALMEIRTCLAVQIAQSIADAVAFVTGEQWAYRTIAARPAPELDYESYVILYQTTNVDFGIIVDGAGQPAFGLSSLQFPNNFSDWNGRRAAYAVFRTTDTLNNFTVSVYHAPPNANATIGIERLAQSPELYEVDNGGMTEDVNFLLLAGDYNISATAYPGDFTWLTDPLPLAPPPSTAGQGADCSATIQQETHLMGWPNPLPTVWSGSSLDYRDYELDNIFADAAGAAGAVYDLVADIMTPASATRLIANDFVLNYPGTAIPAFPNANQLMPPLWANLTNAPWAWALTRWAVSDHLPVVAQVTI